MDTKRRTNMLDQMAWTARQTKAPTSGFIGNTLLLCTWSGRDWRFDGDSISKFVVDPSRREAELLALALLIEGEEEELLERALILEEEE